MTIRTNSMLLLAGLESETNVDPTLTTANAIPTAKFIPGYSYQELSRMVVNQGIDAVKKLIGKETLDMAFEVELMASGSVGVEPAWGPLLEACGFTKETLASAEIDDPFAGFGNAGLSGLVVESAGTFTGAKPLVYKVQVTKTGESGTAEVSVVCRGDATQNSTANVVTSGSAINLGDEGATIEFTFASGSLALGDKWYVHVYPAGIRYRPTAYNGTYKSAHFYHYLGGLLFKGGGARGNVTLNARAGEIAGLSFNFRSVFNAIVDAEIPTHAFPDDVPEIVESSDLSVDDDNTLVVQNISVETGNNITERLNVNSSNGLESFRIASRDNQFAIDPEAELEAEFDFWNKLRTRAEVPMSFKVGSTPGNIVHVQVRRAVFDNLTPSDQEDILRYGITGQCRPSPLGNDNIEIFVC